jgi:RimJ/RimL family protein N-acetyltransferase
MADGAMGAIVAASHSAGPPHPMTPTSTTTSRRRLVTLADGATILLREQIPGDREQLARLFASLSADARYMRFGTGMPPDVPGWVLDRLSAVDGHDHVGLLALHGGFAVAAARFIRSRASPDTAEIALTVTNAWQGRGVGRVLSEALRDAALDRGITRFEFEILPINRRAHALARGMGARPGQRHVDVSRRSIARHPAERWVDRAARR